MMKKFVFSAILALVAVAANAQVDPIPGSHESAAFAGINLDTKTDGASIDFGAATSIGGNLFAAGGVTAGVEQGSQIKVLGKLLYSVPITANGGQTFLAGGPILAAGFDRSQVTNDPTTYFIGATGAWLAVQPLNWSVGGYVSGEYKVGLDGGSAYVDGWDFKIGMYVPFGG